MKVWVATQITLYTHYDVIGGNGKEAEITKVCVYTTEDKAIAGLIEYVLDHYFVTYSEHNYEDKYKWLPEDEQEMRESINTLDEMRVFMADHLPMEIYDWEIRECEIE